MVFWPVVGWLENSANYLVNVKLFRFSICNVQVVVLFAE